MTVPAPHRPVSRPRVLLGAACLLVLLAGVVGIAELLRHPVAPDASPLQEDDGDVRLEISCPDLPPAGPEPAAALPVTSAELLDCPRTYDGRTVEYEGEVVGALLHRRDGVWTQLNDDDYAGDLGPLPARGDFRGGNSGVGVFLPPDLADAVGTVGGPRARGDVLRVTGTFQRVDPVSREVAVIRADGGSVTARGAPTDHPPRRDRRVTGAVLALLALAVTVTTRRAVRR